MSESNPEQKSSRLVTIFGIGFVGVLVFFFVSILIFRQVGAFFEALGRLLTGWFRHLVVNLPVIDWNLTTIALGLGSAIVATAIAHGLIRVLKRKSWTRRQTLMVSGLFLATTAGAIGMTGIVHQLAWLGKTRLTQSDRYVALASSRSNGNQLFFMLLEKDQVSGSFPASLYELVDFHSSAAGILTSKPRGSLVEEPFILLQPGKNTSDPWDIPLLASPLIDGKNHIVVRLDGSAVTMTPEALEEALQSTP